MYYLQSRYYDPQIGRFLNADDSNYINSDNALVSSNLFAYCGNNPVNNVDNEGTWYSPIYDQWQSYVANMKVGTKSTIKHVGCELVAIYNLMLYLNKVDSLSNIIKHAENHGMLYIKSGALGANPTKIRKYLSYRKVRYGFTDSINQLYVAARQGKYCIVTYANKDFFKNGIHTFFLYYSEKDKKYVVFNGYSKYILTKAQYFDKIEQIGKPGRFLCGYFV